MSESNREVLFIIGSPRSGTTWLQLLLAQHPGVATNKETQLFTQYVKRLQDRWLEELREAEAGTTNGLSRIMSEHEFLFAVKGFCDRVLDKLAEDVPDAQVVLEKSPEHGLHAETILSLYPEAWFLHIVRDPRAVSNSFRHAAAKWWAWAPSGPIETTRRWRKNVLAGRHVASLTPRYHEIRYEDLSDRGDEVLLGILNWLGLSGGPEFCQQAIAACDIERLRRGSGGSTTQPWEVGKEPEGFFRAGKQHGWVEDLPASDVGLIEYEAGDLMLELGYQRVSTSGRGPASPNRQRLHAIVSWLQEANRELWHRVDWRLGRLRRGM